ncbi:MAG: signal peptidase I [Lachnospiraceae bacterium]
MRRRKGGLNFYRKRHTINAQVVREAASWSMHIVVAVCLAGWLIYFVGMRTSVIGVSMEDTLYNGQQILVNRISYLIFSPDAGDIVVFQPNGNRNSHYYVKRVIAGPGDRVQIRDGKLYVNDSITDYGYDKIMDPGIAENELLLKEDEFFVMGDNCNNSEDSRSGNIGPVHRDAIEGKAWFKFNSADSYMGLID